MFQGISELVDPTCMIGYSRAGMACIPNTVFTNGSFEVTLPVNTDSGEAFTMCVQLTFEECIKISSKDFTSKSIHAHVVFLLVYHLDPPMYIVPDRNITSPNGGMMSGTSFTVTLDLPITEFQPDQLQIIISLSPNDTAPVVANFPANYQYTVMFSSLMPGTSYTYTVRVVRRSDMMNVVEPFERSFTVVVLCKLLDLCILI